MKKYLEQKDLKKKPMDHLTYHRIVIPLPFQHTLSCPLPLREQLSMPHKG